MEGESVNLESLEGGEEREGEGGGAFSSSSVPCWIQITPTQKIVSFELYKAQGRFRRSLLTSLLSIRITC